MASDNVISKRRAPMQEGHRSAGARWSVRDARGLSRVYGAMAALAPRPFTVGVGYAHGFILVVEGNDAEHGAEHAALHDAEGINAATRKQVDRDIAATTRALRALGCPVD